MVRGEHLKQVLIAVGLISAVSSQAVIFESACEKAQWNVKTAGTDHGRYSDYDPELSSSIPLGLVFDGYGEDAEVTVFDMNADLGTQFVDGTGWFAEKLEGTVGT